ncbi:uncharacterized protein TRUGW13939_00585 [Talaromyces rugulosus]|uniref:Survival protein SurE-like phosphatase/nucleotidase domain-containing protein n=1 Tax=Talaromyces rugulosus TaxID=121627 RepID=A0A7H8QHY3_TALRU|nr:uncharacterized protein TRUGW13939_00585 [Talaromyces rugulosus]QKX53506.1 hypothetical protein TRUGW13939_00585 [Talaromyces rugulosus]
MHILVVNDDGPPSRTLSPYVRPLVDALQEAGHQVSVAVPAMSRSWIGKAHIIGASLTATYVHPDQFRDDGSFPSTTTTTHQNNHQHQQGLPLTPAASDEHLRAAQLSTTTSTTTTTSTHDNNDWVVVTNGTPASCAQLGIYELFRDRGEIDLVVSGPNHGRNASTIFNLSSGTVGGALEAVTCAKRGIALSFGSKDEQPKEVIRAAAKLSTRLIEYLYRNWDGKVELYNVNVPMRADVETRPVRYTTALPIVWTKGSLYAESKSKSNGSAVSSHETTEEKSLLSSPPRERHFQWSAELSDIKQSLREGPEGTDARTVLDGFTSVTPLLANFWHPPGFAGELTLDN